MMTTLTLQQAIRAVESALTLAENRYANRPLSVAVCDASEGATELRPNGYSQTVNH